MTEQRYPSCTDDAEWALIADLFDNDAKRSIPALFASMPGRRLLLCCLHGLCLADVAGRLPPGQNVYRTFRRWADAGKKVKGRKRNIVVDMLGLLLAVTVTDASVQDRDAAPAAVAQTTAKYPSAEALFEDRGYTGQYAKTLRAPMTSPLMSFATRQSPRRRLAPSGPGRGVPGNREPQWLCRLAQTLGRRARARLARAPPSIDHTT